MKVLLTRIKLFLERIKARLSGNEGLYYVNGPETLPAPIGKEEEERVFRELERGSLEAKNILITHNLRLVVYIAKKFESTGINVEDLVSIGAIGLIKAVNTFTPSKNIKLATYASRCIENEILMCSVRTTTPEVLMPPRKSCPVSSKRFSPALSDPKNPM